MNFMRAILASLLSLVCTLAVSTFVTLQTLETTVLDKNEVKGWVDKSGVYDHLLTTVLSTNGAAQQELGAAGSSIVTSDDMTSALGQTLDSGFIKQSTEKVIDSTYSWLNNKSSTISFEINTTDKKDAFISNLSTILQPQLAQLPQCLSVAQFQSNNPPCLPQGTTPKQAADGLATDAANGSSIFTQPVTSKTLAESSSSTAQSNSPLTSANSSTNSVRTIVSNLQMWLIWLPIIAVVSGGLMVLLSQHRLKAAKHLAGRLTVGLVITFAAGLLIANVGRTFSLKNYTDANSAIVTQIIEPVIHQAAPAIGNRLALVSGILGLVTFILWIVLRVIKKRLERAELLNSASDELKVTVPPAKASDAPTPTPSQTSAPSAPQSQPAPTNSRPAARK